MSAVMDIPAYPGSGPNFLVSEARGFRSREQIVLKHDPGAALYPDGLVLQREQTEVPESEPVEYEPGERYVPYDGTGEAAALLYQATDVSKADVKATGMVRDCEVQRANLKFAGTLTGAQKDDAYASLATAHVVMR